MTTAFTIIMALFACALISGVALSNVLGMVWVVFLGALAALITKAIEVMDD